VYFSRINPLVRFELTDTGLAFENPAVKARFSESPKQGYQATWSRFNNSTGATDQIGRRPPPARNGCRRQRSAARGEQLRKGLGPRRRTPHAPWATPVDVYFRRDGNAWRLVGVDRDRQVTDVAGAVKTERPSPAVRPCKPSHVSCRRQRVSLRRLDCAGLLSLCSSSHASFVPFRQQG
jgi:hypothetical protein